MKPINHYTLALATVLLMALTPVGAAELVVIVNADNPTGVLTAAEVRNYYLKRSSVWGNGEKVRPVDQGSGLYREAFLVRVLEINEEGFVRYWLERQYANADKPPTRVNDDDAVIKFVGALKGAIGFVDKASLSGPEADKVRPVLTVGY